MSFKSFIISRAFFKHLALMFVVIVVFIFITIKGLDIYTHNGDYILIPDLESYDADSLMDLSSPDYLQYEIVDSMYADERMPGTVVMQHPKSGAKVKSGRKVYLSIVAKTPEMVEMPNLLDLSIRRAVDVLHYAHLKVERMDFVDDIALNAVLAQLHNGDTIKPDTLLPSGSAIQLIAGNGYNKTGVSVPFLIGKTPAQAKEMILKSSFNIGRIDTLKQNFEKQWRVYEQNPHVDPMEAVRAPLGMSIDIKLRSDLGFDFDFLLHFYQLPDSLRYDSQIIDDELTNF